MDNAEKDVLIDIDSDELNSGPSSGAKRGNVSLKKLVSGFLNFNGEPRECENEVTKLLLDKSGGGPESVPLLDKAPEMENERRKSGKVKKAAKPPRPPKGPTLDAADMRLLKELAKTAKRKQDRIERVKAMKKMKAAKAMSSSSSSPSSPSYRLASSGAAFLAMFITGFFFLMIILQGLSSSTSSHLTIVGAPQPAPGTTD